mgnify:CR=1 FL=1
MTKARPFLLAALSFAGLTALGLAILDGFVLDLGSIHLPRPAATSFMLFYGLFGTLAAVALAWGVAGTGTGRAAWARLQAAADDVPDHRWILAGSLLAFLVAGVVRVLVLGGVELTDDEAAYRFMSQVLAGGRVTADSPPAKLFFDRIFLVNDGRYFAQYFLGWPALMLPGTLLGLSGWMNALYSALTVPGLFLILRRLCGRGGARLGVLLYLAAPMVTVGAATGLSHTSCLMLLTWLAWAVLRSRDAAAPPWSHALVGAAFAGAFFVRPATAVGLGAPLLVLWLLGLRAQAGRARLVALAACAGPAAAFGGLFLAVNHAQTGEWLRVAYSSYQDYVRGNGMRFYFPGGFTEPASQWQLDDPVRSLAYQAGAVLRLNLALFGWPLSLLFVPFAAREGRVFRWMLAAFFGLHFFTWDAGVDSFGPVHYFECALPLIVLTVLGIQRMHRWLSAAPSGGPPRDLVPALVASLILVSLLVYAPARGGALHRMGESIALPQAAVEDAGVTDAVVFVPFPFVADCAKQPTYHFRFYWPVNTPELTDAVLWANHLDLASDRAMVARHFPERRGFYLGWTPECRPVLVPLDAPGLQIPRGALLGVDRILPDDQL